MIGKAPATGSGFAGLINYLMLGKLADQNPDRVAWTDVRNLAVDDLHLVPRIMRSTAKQAILCEKPVYHLVVSWHKDENPSEEAMRIVADTTLADLELVDHQALLVAHRDTDHHHLHLVINRVHPETGKAWDRWQDWPRIEKSLGRQAQEMGFMFVPGRHILLDVVPVDGGPHRDCDVCRRQFAGPISLRCERYLCDLLRGCHCIDRN